MFLFKIRVFFNSILPIVNKLIKVKNFTNVQWFEVKKKPPCGGGRGKFKLQPWRFCSPDKLGIFRVPVCVAFQAAVFAQRRYDTNDHAAKNCERH